MCLTENITAMNNHQSRTALFFKLLSTVMITVTLVSCENSRNYSQLLEQEERNIESWLASENITIIDEFPADSIFSRNEMYHYTDGIYFQMFDKGEGDTLRNGDQIIMRYKQIMLDKNPVEESYWDTTDRPYPNEEIRYGSLQNSCEGWQTAFSLMKRSGAHARIIVPSKLGRDDTNVVAYVYEMKIKIVPK